MKITVSLSILLTASALTGCNQVGVPDMMSTGTVFGSAHSPAYAHTIAENRPVQEAFVKLPYRAGNVVEVIEKRHGNGVEQVVVYAGDNATRGQNAARIQLVSNNVWPKPQTGNLAIAPVSQAAISSEMRKALPGVRMTVSNQLHSNAYGPYGFATGRTHGNVTCLYGWQHMKGEKRRYVGVPLFNMKSAKPELSLRIRLCREGASKRDMVDIMQQIRVEADPDAVLARKAVSWGSGPRDGSVSMALPDYEPGGYSSDTSLPVAVEQPVVRRAAVVQKRKSVRRKSVSRKVKRVASSTNARIVKKRVNEAAFVPLPSPTSVASVTPVTRAANRTRYNSPINQAFPQPKKASVPVKSVLKTQLPKAGQVPLPN